MVYRHIDAVKEAAVFSGCGRYRYRLDISLQTGSGNNGATVCAILQNPSVANAEVADKSVQFLEKLIFSKGLEPFENVDKLIVVNQFALIQTNDFSGADIGDHNDQYIRDAIAESDIVLVAWGARNPYIQRKQVIEGFLKSCKGKKLLRGQIPSVASTVCGLYLRLFISILIRFLSCGPPARSMIGTASDNLGDKKELIHFPYSMKDLR